MSHLDNCWTTTDFSKFKPEEHFKEYHYFEKFDEKKEYISNDFIQDFGYGTHVYRYQLYNLSEKENCQKYIVVIEQLSEQEQLKLAPYCPCPYHQMSRFNPMRYFVCKCCVGCLDSNHPQTWVINKARKRMNKSNKD
jgi:hypothetical protein